MPELPEVETIAKQLNRVLRGKEIIAVKVLRDTSFKGNEQELLRKVVSKVDRAAKILVIDFKNWDKVLMIHLKMTGQLVWRLKDWDKKEFKDEVAGGHPTIDWMKELPSKHTRVIVGFRDESQLFFNDLRGFGWMKLVLNSEFKIQVSKLPPDVVDKGFSLDYFKNVLKRSRRSIKLVLMDQAKMGGVGNIYANDALFEAEINPKRVSNDLSEEEVDRLYKAVKRVIALGIKYGGATYNDFVSATGLGGKYQKYFLVYGRDGKKCRKCGEKIKKIKLGGRGTYFCKRCQR